MKRHLIAALIASAAGPVLAQGAMGDARESIGELTRETPDYAKTHDVTVVEFDEASARLSQDGQDRIRKIVDTAKRTGKIDTVYVAAWSDKPFPLDARQDLPESDQVLARRRGDGVSDFLRMGLDVKVVKIFNMARGTTWLAKLFNTEDAEIKKVFAGEESKLPTKERLEIQSIRNNGKPGVAVVVVEHEPSSVAH